MACATAVGRLMLAGVATCAAASANAEPARVAVRDILSAPFASELTAAPAGGSLAWIVKLEGARNIWVAQPPEYKAQRLTSFVADDGQDISRSRGPRTARRSSTSAVATRIVRASARTRSPIPWG